MALAGISVADAFDYVSDSGPVQAQGRNANDGRHTKIRR